MCFEVPLSSLILCIVFVLNCNHYQPRCQSIGNIILVNLWTMRLSLCASPRARYVGQIFIQSCSFYIGFCSLYFLYCPLYFVHFTSYIVFVYGSLYIVLWIVYSIQAVHYSSCIDIVLCRLNFNHCTVYIVFRAPSSMSSDSLYFVP